MFYDNITMFYDDYHPFDLYEEWLPSFQELKLKAAQHRRYQQNRWHSRVDDEEWLPPPDPPRPTYSNDRHQQYPHRQRKAYYEDTYDAPRRRSRVDDGEWLPPPDPPRPTYSNDGHQQYPHRQRKAYYEDTYDVPRRRANKEQVVNIAPRRRANKEQVVNVAPRRRANREKVVNVAPIRRAYVEEVVNVAPRRRAYQKEVVNIAPRRRANEDQDVNLALRRRANQDQDVNLALRQRANREEVDTIAPTRRAYVEEVVNVAPRRRAYQKEVVNVAPRRRAYHEQVDNVAPCRHAHHEEVVNVSPQRRACPKDEYDALVKENTFLKREIEILKARRLALTTAVQHEEPQAVPQPNCELVVNPFFDEYFEEDKEEVIMGKEEAVIDKVEVIVNKEEDGNPDNGTIMLLDHKFEPPNPSLKMVKVTMIARVTDGLPLAEGLDDGQAVPDAEYYKQQMKSLFKNLSKGHHEASRMSIESGPYVFHYIIEGRVCYLTMCDRAYPKKLAFQYLEDLRNEFERVNGSQIETAARPYAFIKFDTFIQKTKKLYQDTQTQRNIAKLNDELYEVHQIMTRNVQEVLGVGEKLDQVSQMSSRLTSESRVYADKARDLNRQALIKKWAPVAIVIGVVILLFWVRKKIW